YIRHTLITGRVVSQQDSGKIILVARKIIMIFILRYLVVCKIAIGRLRERTSKKSENSAVPVVSNSKNSFFRGTFKKKTPKIEKFFDRLKGGIQKGGA
ncbi:MAG: hypothetical protein K2P46_01760, partial [Alistipes sp.]|nr:hypothetical protein [Alistipes sp.]